jgi:uncharacterized protein YqhQ
MDDGFLANSLVVYIKRKIAKSFNLNSILDDFVSLKFLNTLYSRIFVLVPCFIASTYLRTFIMHFCDTYCVTNYLISILNCIYYIFSLALQITIIRLPIMTLEKKNYKNSIHANRGVKLRT